MKLVGLINFIEKYFSIHCPQTLLDLKLFFRNYKLFKENPNLFLLLLLFDLL